MIGKRIILTLIGAAVLLSLSVLVVAQVLQYTPTETPLSVPTSSVSVANDLERESDIVAEPEATALVQSSELQITVRSDTATPVDVYVVSDWRKAGYDSSADEMYTDSVLHYDRQSVTETGAIEQIVSIASSTDVQSVTVYIIGVSGAVYELAGNYVTTAGEKYELARTEHIEQYDMHTYRILLHSGEVSREVVSGETRRKAKVATDAPVVAAGCEGLGLQQQLADLLQQRGWSADEEEQLHVSIQKMTMDDMDAFGGRPVWPFGYEAVCVLREVYTSDRATYERLLSDFSHTEQAVMLQGETFGPSMADGPLSSLVAWPFTTDDESVQFIKIAVQQKLMALDFPRHSVCPCQTELEFMLTAPLYPVGHARRSD